MRPLTIATALMLVLLASDGDPIDQLLHGRAPGPPPPQSWVITASPLPPPLSANPTTCEAPALAYLVGRPRTEIPVPVNPSRRRVSCANCPVTQDYRPDRTDILFDEATGLITAVKCG